MDKFNNREDLIAALTEDLTPVTKVKQRDGLLLIAFSTLVAAVISIVGFELWTGMFTGEASGFFWITNGFLLVSGLAASVGLVSGALPRVGAQASAPKWTAATLAIIPVAAMISIFSNEAGHAHGGLADPTLFYWPCAAASLGAGLIVAMGAILFLRRGAPVSLERSGWLTGIAAGALGSLAYGITCPLDGLAHVGIVHIVPVAISAVIGRFAVPPLIRW